MQVDSSHETPQTLPEIALERRIGAIVQNGVNPQSNTFEGG